MTAGRVIRAPSWRVVRLRHDPSIEPAASWERLAVWCAIRERPLPDDAIRVTWSDHDPAAPGHAVVRAVGCAVGPGVVADGEFEVTDTPGGWCAEIAAPGGAHELAEAALPDGWVLEGAASWTLGHRTYWPVRTAPRR